MSMLSSCIRRSYSLQRCSLSRATYHPFRHQYISSSAGESIGNEIVLQRWHGNENIATLTFNRPKKANSMGRVMLGEFHDIISRLSGEECNDVRCLVLTSCSDRVFSAGADLRERSEMSMEEATSFVTSLRECLSGLSLLPMPMIASIEGAALGGGLEIALTADLIVAGENAKFGLPETSLAIIPGAGGTQRLPRLIGVSRAKELIYTARKIDAKTSLQYGIVQHVTDVGHADQKAMQIAQEIAQNGPLAIRAAKESITWGLEAGSLEDALKVEQRCYGKVIPTKDRLEGLAAFKEKRKPDYTGN